VQQTTATLTDAELSATISDNTKTSGEVTQILVDNSPLSDSVLIDAVTKNGLLPEDLKLVLHENGALVQPAKLSDQVLLTTVYQKVLGEADLVEILIENSPLSSDVLNAAKSIKPPIDSALIADLEAAQ
jgi:hypothetical protein